MTTDWKALCIELADALERAASGLNNCTAQTGYRSTWAHEAFQATSRARAALAEPESEWPTDEEIMKLLPEDLHKEFANWSRIYADQAGIKPGIFRVILNTLVLDFARAVLNKYGNHPVSPDGSSLRQQAMGALYAIASGADDTREFYQDIETIKLALEQLK